MQQRYGAVWIMTFAFSCANPMAPRTGRKIVATAPVPPVSGVERSEDAAVASNPPGALAAGSGVTVTLAARSGSTASGVLNVVPGKDGTRLIGIIEGLAPSAQHGLHIHAVGDCSASDAASAGDEFSPGLGAQRLSGALEALTADAAGKAAVNLILPGFNLTAANPANVLGRSLVVYQKADETSGKNTSARWACGVIADKPPAE